MASVDYNILAAGGIMRAMIGMAVMVCCAAQAAPNEKDAVALAEKGAQFVRAHGRAEMVARINSKDRNSTRARCTWRCAI
jgi:hypothetical protein